MTNTKSASYSSLKYCPIRVFLLRLQIVWIADLAVDIFLPPVLLPSSKRTVGILSTFGSVTPKNLQFLCIIFFQQCHHVLQKSGLHRHDIFKTIDISHLKIQGWYTRSSDAWYCAFLHGIPAPSQIPGQIRRPSSACKTEGSAASTAGLWKYSSRNRFAPPSALFAPIFGVWISVNP